MAAWRAAHPDLNRTRNRAALARWRAKPGNMAKLREATRRWRAKDPAHAVEVTRTAARAWRVWLKLEREVAELGKTVRRLLRESMRRRST